MDDFNENENKIESETEPEAYNENAEPVYGSGQEQAPDMMQNAVNYEYNCPPADEKNNNGRKTGIIIITLLILIFTAVSVLTVYFIYTDVKMGSIEFNKRMSNDNGAFSLKLHGNPAGGKNTMLPDEDGKYTLEGLAEYINPQIVELYAYSSSGSNGGVFCGSGIIISEDGYIVTNTHILDGDAATLPAGSDAVKPDRFVVITSDKKKHDAEIIGRDKKTDIAVIKIDGSGFPCAELGNSDEVIVGEHVAAIGNPEGFTGSITDGIVSGVDRKIQTDSTKHVINCIQTNAAINHGSSGGALVNMYGQVIGITTSKLLNATAEGIGFAISINDAKPIIEELVSHGYVSGRVRIGISFLSMDNTESQAVFKEKYGKDIPENLKGLWITDVSEDCDISKTELKPDDFIIKVNGIKIRNYNELCSIIENKKGGDTLKAECARIDKDMNISYFDIEFRLMEDKSGDF